MALVIDDHLLIDVLAHNQAQWLRAEMARSAIYTTGSWYYRVASAARRGSGTGSLSGRLAQLDPEQAARARSRIEELPDWIGLLGPRLLVPIMSRLETRRTPNLLTAEALAVALVVDGAIAVTTDAALLRESAQDLGIEYRKSASDPTAMARHPHAARSLRRASRRALSGTTPANGVA